MEERLKAWIVETRALATLAASDFLIEQVMEDVADGNYDTALRRLEDMELTELKNKS